MVCYYFFVYFFYTSVSFHCCSVLVSMLVANQLVAYGVCVFHVFSVLLLLVCFYLALLVEKLWHFYSHKTYVNLMGWQYQQLSIGVHLKSHSTIQYSMLIHLYELKFQPKDIQEIQGDCVCPGWWGLISVARISLPLLPTLSCYTLTHRHSKMLVFHTVMCHGEQNSGYFIC